MVTCYRLPVERRFAYLHGFASSPLSKKAVELEPFFAIHNANLQRPDLNRPSFGRLSRAAMLAAVDELDSADTAPWCFIGSSLGGWLAAMWAQAHPERVERLVLLCPGFDLAARWSTILGHDAFEEWRERGFVTVPDAAGVPTRLHWRFMEEAAEYPGTPGVSCPTLIVHGRADEIVPIESSRRYAAARDHVTLVEVDDDHSLAGSLASIAEHSLRFFGLE